MTTVGPEQVLAWRAARQHLADRAPAGALLDVASEIGGLHAQVMSSAELTAWARLREPDPDAVPRALWEERALVKTWAMRGTLQLLPAAELALWLGALQTIRPRWLAPAWQRTFGVSAGDMERLLDALPVVLAGEPLGREQLADAIAAETGTASIGDALRESWGSVLKPAAFLGRICFATNDGQKVRFTSPERWLGGWEPADDPHAAAAEVTRRYLARYGPVTREDLARWLGAPPAHGGRLLKALGDELATVSVAGAELAMLAADVEELAATELRGDVRLLPAFDQLVVAAPRGVLAAELHQRVYRPQGWLSPALLVDGAMRGVWRHERRGAALRVAIEPFGPRVAKAVRASAEAEAERLAAYLGGGALAVSWA